MPFLQYKNTPPLLAKVEAECYIQDNPENEHPETYRAADVEAGDKALFPPCGHPFPIKCN